MLNILLAVLALEGAAVSVEQLPLDDIVRDASVVSRVRRRGARACSL